jgi:hypothetical protein
MRPPTASAKGPFGGELAEPRFRAGGLARQASTMVRGLPPMAADVVITRKKPI